ncbi:MAG: hypothetical protein R6U96_03910 [Promethearchaeia archaeon]
MEVYEIIKSEIEKYPFITIIGKYDQVLGPRALYSSVEFEDKQFVRNLLRDALNTKNEYVILDFEKFYSQISKIEVKDPNARGGKQLYAIILLRHGNMPLLPILHFKRIEMMFHKIGEDKILADNAEAFKKFVQEVNEIYLNKNEILPLESLNLQIRSGVNTIQGFCQLILQEKKKKGEISEENVLKYVKMMLDSCDEIINGLKNHLNGSPNK